MPSRPLTINSFLSIGESHDTSGTPFRLTGIRDYVRTFYVEMDSMDWGPLEACCCPDLPSPASPYYNPKTDVWDGLCLLTEASADRMDKYSPWWVIKCKYTNDIPRSGIPHGVGLPVDRKGNKSGGVANNPEMEPPEVEYEYEEVSVPMVQDLNGQPFLNSAWEPLSVSVPFQRSIFVLTRNELFFDMSVGADYAGTVNNNPFAGFPTDSVLCMAPRAKMMFRGPFAYWRVTYRLKFGYKKGEGKFESFQQEMLDEGFNERISLGVDDDTGDPIGFKYTHIRDGNGALVRRPQLLNGEGRKQKEFLNPDLGDFGVKDGRLKPVYLPFKTRRRKDFTKLFLQGKKLDGKLFPGATFIPPKKLPPV